MVLRVFVPLLKWERGKPEKYEEKYQLPKV